MATVHYDSHHERVEALILGESFDGLVDAAEFLLTESRAESPLDEGTLERSGAVTQDRPALRVHVSYDTPYAVRQHEELTWEHPQRGKAKYLEDPANQLEGQILAIVATKARRAFRGGA